MSVNVVKLARALEQNIQRLACGHASEFSLSVERVEARVQAPDPHSVDVIPQHWRAKIAFTIARPGSAPLRLTFHLAAPDPPGLVMSLVSAWNATPGVAR